MTRSAVEVPVLAEAQFLERSRAKRPQSLNYYAFYSSFVGGIVKDPTLMTLPVDDHLVHRGHGVFDTASLVNGHLYRLEIHLDRFIESARLAKIVPPFPRDVMREIILKTCAVSGQRNGSVRYWLGAGPGDIGITPAAGGESTFYCLVYGGIPLPHELMEIGMKEVTIKNVPMKPPLLANMKSNNYLLNALTAMEARERGGKFGILVHEDGTLAESCVMNISIISPDGVYKTPTFDAILPGTTVRASMDIARQLVAQGNSKCGIKEVVQTKVTLDELLGAKEAFLSSGDTHVFPIVEVDGHRIGDGKVGPYSRHLLAKLVELSESSNSPDHTPIDYSEA